VPTGFWWGNQRFRYHLEDVGINRMVILKWIFNDCYGEQDFIGLALARDSRQAVVYTVLNLRVVQNAENLLTSCQTVSFSITTLLYGVNDGYSVIWLFIESVLSCKVSW
jgi:hypothetical protein